MEIEDFWKCIPSYKQNEKGQNGYIGYGYVKKKKHRRESCRKSRYRNACREIRKYGFALSETWRLAYTICRWLSDTFGGVFREMGAFENWSQYTLEGKWTFDAHIGLDADAIRVASFKKHLKNLLDTASEDDWEKIISFCVPRLRAMAKHLRGFPVCSTPDYAEEENGRITIEGPDGYWSFKTWKASIYKMADKLEQHTYSRDFIEFFFCLWD